jgi:hypothetical protein
MSKISEKSLPCASQDADAAIIGVDLGKTVFQLCVADSAWRVTAPMATPNCSTYGRSNCSR